MDFQIKSVITEQKRLVYHQYTMEHRVQQPIQSTKPNKLFYLDSIRGLAALGVVFHHAHFLMADYLKTYRDWQVWSGDYFVSVFFVLSGRVLALGFMKYRTPAYLSSCMIRRPFRLGLPVLACLLFMSFIGWIKFWERIGYRDYTKDIPISPWGGYYVDNAEPLSVYECFKNTIFIFSYDYHKPPYPAGVLWTLGLECFMSYYVYIIALIYVSVRSGKLVLVGLVLHAFFVGKRYGLFLYGLVLCVCFQERLFGWMMVRHRTRRFFTTALKLFILYTIYLLQSTNRLDNWLSWLNGFIFAEKPDDPLQHVFASVLLVFVVDVSPTLQTLLNISPLVYLGRISFGLYMMHGPALPLLRIMVAFYTKRQISEDFGYPIALLIYLIISVFLAHLMTHFVDEPAMRLVTKMDKWFFHTGPPIRLYKVPPHQLPMYKSDKTYSPVKQEDREE